MGLSLALHPVDFTPYQFAHLGGEISSHKSQLKTWEDDLKDFKDINKRYTDQLIRVKVRRTTHFDGHRQPVVDPDVRYGE